MAARTLGGFYGHFRGRQLVRPFRAQPLEDRYASLWALPGARLGRPFSLSNGESAASGLDSAGASPGLRLVCFSQVIEAQRVSEPRFFCLAQLGASQEIFVVGYIMSIPVHITCLLTNTYEYDTTNPRGSASSDCLQRAPCYYA
jgi:hypothetical protein